METLEISRSKLVKLLIDSEGYDDMSREDLIEVLKDSDRMYFENLEIHQLEAEAIIKLNKKVTVVED